MILSQINDHGHQHWERFGLVSLEDVKEVIVFEETHCAIGNLKMDTANALNDSFEQFRD